MSWKSAHRSTGIYNNVRCDYCRWKPEDSPSDIPEGFKRIDGEWLCDECRTELPPFTIATNPSDSEIAGVRE